jgi:hypothetical protein
MFFFHSHNAALPQPRSPSPPIQPVKTNRDLAMYQQNNKQHSNNLMCSPMHTTAVSIISWHSMQIVRTEAGTFSNSPEVCHN